MIRSSFTDKNGEPLELKDLVKVDHYYFNLTFFNNGDQYKIANVVQPFDRTILFEPQKWNMAIARFSISSDYIARAYQPLGTTSVNTKEWVSLSYNGTYYDSPVVLPTVLSPSGVFIQAAYDVNSFLNIVNAAYAASYAAVVAAGGPTGAYGQVLMTYEPQDGLYFLNVPTYFGTGGIGMTAGDGIGVHMSYALYHRFLSFNTFQNVPLLNNNHDVTFVRYLSGNNITTIEYPVGVTGKYLALAQDAPWASSIMDVTRLLISTTTIPITPEFRTQQFYMQFDGNPANQSLPIVTDFFIGEDSSIINSAESFLYTPTLLRLTSLQGTNPIRQMDIEVSFATSDGTIYPLWLAPGDNIDIKFLFLKKGLTS